MFICDEKTIGSDVLLGMYVVYVVGGCTGVETRQEGGRHKLEYDAASLFYS